ncbi:MAG: signal peptidase II [Proteobacteria bacterium]|nr:signal peptidase II [Pseudomonadota bacterium]
MLVIGLALAAITLVVDQAVKVLLIALLTDPDRVIAVTGFLNLVYVKNFGVSFGLFNAGSSAGPWILSILSVAVAAGLVLWLRRVESKWLGAAIGLIIGGALGNAVDRVRLGSVADFFDFYAFGFHWFAFNVADAAIVGGVAFIVLDGLFSGPEKSQNE